MDFSYTILGTLLGFLFTLAQLGFIPAIAAYFVARSRLKNGKKRLRGWKPVLTGVLVLVFGMALSLELPDTWDGIGFGILSYIAAGALIGIGVGFAVAWLDFKPIDPFN